MVAVDVGKVVGADGRAFGQLLRPAIRGLPNEQLLDSLECVGFNDSQLVIEVFAETTELIVNDLLICSARP